jgi:hypothetical protein
MTKTTRGKSESDKLADNSISEEEAVQAAREAFTFLTACMRDEIEGLSLGERIHAANAVLTHTTKVPRLMDALLEGAGMLSEDDVAMIAAALD